MVGTFSELVAALMANVTGVLCRLVQSFVFSTSDFATVPLSRNRHHLDRAG